MDQYLQTTSALPIHNHRSVIQAQNGFQNSSQFRSLEGVIIHISQVLSMFRAQDGYLVRVPGSIPGGIKWVEDREILHIGVTAKINFGRRRSCYGVQLLPRRGHCGCYEAGVRSKGSVIPSRIRFCSEVWVRNFLRK